MPYRPQAPAEALAQEGLLRVTRNYPDGKTEQASESIVVRQFQTEPAKVGASVKRSINTGPYESYTVEASVYLPCYAEEAGDALRAASDIATHFVVAEEVSVRKLYGLKQALPKDFLNLVLGEAEEETAEEPAQENQNETAVTDSVDADEDDGEDEEW